MELVTIKTLWGNCSFDYALSSSLGNSWAILCVWEPTLFIKDNVTLFDNFLAIMGTWVPSSSKILIIFVNAPQDLTEKRVLWDYILRLIDGWDGDCVIMGDFNEVRMEQEKYGSIFNVQGDNAFNSFISLASLIDLPLDGYAYTWANKTANKMSKLDRFLVSKGLLVSFLFRSALFLDRNLSDHRPILMWELSIDYGPTPFRFFQSWFNLDGFDKMVEDTWKSLATVDSNGMINLKKKLQALKIALNNGPKMLRKALIRRRSPFNPNNLISSKFLTKAVARESDENTMFFHGILNSKCSQLAIRRTLADGERIVDPLAVKSVFLKYFFTQFSSPGSPRIFLADQFTDRLSLEQQTDLERNVSNEKIKSVVRYCGTNKSHGLDGFTFEFFRRY
ncbi:RNA-directed DNA polymerase, eukaryota [Tanacetum coccineum]